MKTKNYGGAVMDEIGDGRNKVGLQARAESEPRDYQEQRAVNLQLLRATTVSFGTVNIMPLNVSTLELVVQAKNAYKAKRYEQAVQAFSEVR